MGSPAKRLSPPLAKGGGRGDDHRYTVVGLFSPGRGRPGRGRFAGCSRTGSCQRGPVAFELGSEFRGRLEADALEVVLKIVAHHLASVLLALGRVPLLAAEAGEVGRGMICPLAIARLDRDLAAWSGGRGLDFLVLLDELFHLLAGHPGFLLEIGRDGILGKKVLDRPKHHVGLRLALRSDVFARRVLRVGGPWRRFAVVLGLLSGPARSRSATTTDRAASRATLLISLAGLACGLAATWLRPSSGAGLIPLGTLLAALLGLLAAAGPLRGSAAFPARLVALIRIAALAWGALAVLAGSFAGLLAVACL